MSALPKFNGASACPKCGGVDVGAEWVGPDAHWRPHGCSEKAEHIHRNCRRCGFRWNESPLNGGTP